MRFFFQEALIITRNRPAAERPRSYGVTAPMELTADNAFNFCTSPADEGWPRRAGPWLRVARSWPTLWSRSTGGGPV